MNTIFSKGCLTYLAVVIALLVPAKPGKGDTILYGSTGDANANGGGRVYMIDVTTQTVTLVGDTGFDRLGAIAFDSTGVLYGAAGGALNSLPGTLITIDLNASAAATTVGTFAPNLGVEALRFNSLNTLYGGALDTTGGAHGVLLTIDPTNANVLSQISTIGSGTNALTPGLAFDSSDQLYGSRGNSNLHLEDVDLVDPSTGQLTPLPLSIPDSSHPISDLVFGSDGILYGASAFGQLYKIDPITGLETLLFDTQILKFSGLASQPIPTTPQGVPDTGGSGLFLGFALVAILFLQCRASLSTNSRQAV